MTLTEIARLALDFVWAEEAFRAAVEANARSTTHSLEVVRPLEAVANQRYAELVAAAAAYQKKRK